MIKGEVFDSSSLVMMESTDCALLDSLLLEDILDFVIAQDSSRVRTWPWLRAPTELTSGPNVQRQSSSHEDLRHNVCFNSRIAGWICKLECSTVETKTHHYLLGRHIHTPKQLSSELYLGQIGMTLYDRSDRVILVPYACAAKGNGVSASQYVRLF
jgi:hypothetical protein